MERSEPQRPALDETVLSVPAMTCRHCVRAVSARVRDVAGVIALEADTVTGTLRVQGPTAPDALRAAIAAAGYEAVVMSQKPTGGHLS